MNEFAEKAWRRKLRSVICEAIFRDQGILWIQKNPADYAVDSIHFIMLVGRSQCLQYRLC